MSSHKNNVIVTLLYEDGSTRNYTFEDVADSDLNRIKAKIKAINENSNDEYANFYKTFISEDGNAVIEINSCKIISYQEEVIYNG